MNETIKTILTRRSVRSYTDSKVAKADLEIILQAATFAPSGRNIQNWRFTVVQNQEILKKLNEAIKKAQNRTSDYVCYYGAPVLIIASAPADNVLGSFDCACALQNMFLAAESLGLASCWINQIGQSCADNAVREILTSLGLPLDHMVYGCAAIGYTQSRPPAPPRKEGAVHWV